MYKILIKKPQLPKDTFTFYSETTSIVDEETEKVTKKTAIFESDDLETVKEKYKILLGTYTTAEMKVVQDLDVEMIINITDN
nr:MAG TPA: hypothetical protein [Bacteriophage sp.]